MLFLIFPSFPPDTADASTSGYPCTAEYGAPVMPNSVLGGYPGIQKFNTKGGPNIFQRAPTYYSGKCSHKLHEMKKNWAKRGACVQNLSLLICH